MNKQKPCCARFTAKLHHDESNLVKLARKAALLSSRNRDITRLKELIAEAKETIASDKRYIADHEAMHAGEEV